MLFCNRYKLSNQEYIIMKGHSPAHRIIQLKRKTEKIVIPKMSWDLSNKQNHNFTNVYETSKSKNNSSKKNSIDRKCEIKKTLSMTQNLLKNTLKKFNKNQIMHKDKKQLSLQKIQKKSNNLRKQERKNASALVNNHFVDEMSRLLKKAKRKQPTLILKQNYKQCFSSVNSKTEWQKSMMSIMSQHIEFWMQKCESLQSTLSMICEKTPKLECHNILSEGCGRYSEEKGQGDELDSQVSLCSYIVDPKEQVKMKPIKKELKQQLQLNFEKVEYFRKKQF